MERHYKLTDRMVVVIPAFNEEQSIAKTVTEAISYCPVIVVNDCSTDHTSSVARSHGAYVIDNRINLRYDKTLEVGFQAACAMGYDYILTLDGDGQHPTQMIPEFYKALENGADVVLGIRGSYQRIGEILFAAYTYVGFRIVDPLCGMKAYRATSFKKIGFFDSVGSTGTELMMRSILSGAKMKQLRIETNKRKDMPRFEGNSLRANLKIIKSLLRIRKIVGSAQ